MQRPTPSVDDAAPPHPVVAVVGPTATGKSDLAVRLSLEVGGEVVGRMPRSSTAGWTSGPPS